MEVILVFALLVGCLVWAFKSIGGNDEPQKKTVPFKIPEIDKAKSISDIVMSLNHGRVYPYSTGMSIERVRGIIKDNNLNTSNFDNHLQFYQMIGVTPCVEVPQMQNDFVERITITTKDNVVSSIGVDIKNFDKNMKPLVEEIALKFGNPTSMDNEFIIWREGCMVVNVCKNGSLAVIDERLFGNA